MFCPSNRIVLRKINVLFHLCFQSFTLETLKTQVKLNLNFTWPNGNAISYMEFCFSIRLHGFLLILNFAAKH